MHCRLRHVVRIDGVVGAADIGAARDAEAATIRHTAVALFPRRGFFDPAQTLQKAVGAHAKAIDRGAIGADEVSSAQLDGIDAEGHGGLVELALNGEAGLNATMAALGPAGGLIGIGAGTVKAVARKRIGGGQKLPRVIGGH